MNNAFWTHFHDGGLASIDGTVPGDLTLHISVRCLRQQFGGEGTGFVVKLAVRDSNSGNMAACLLAIRQKSFAWGVLKLLASRATRTW